MSDDFPDAYSKLVGRVADPKHPEARTFPEPAVELSLSEKTQKIEQAETFPELYAALDSISTVQGSKEEFSAEQLKDKINRVQSGALTLKYITRTYGLREKVEDLLETRSGTNKVNIPETPAVGAYESSPFTVDTILKADLAYQDTSLPPELKANMLKGTESSESARKYAGALGAAAHEQGLESVRDLARTLRANFLAEAGRLGIVSSPYGESLSWAMWDIGKQYYYYLHPDENELGYVVGNPLTSEEKRQEIINRHLGWEAYRTLDAHGTRNIPLQFITKNISGFLNTAPKQNGTLPSNMLEDLGALLRKGAR